MFLGDRKNIIQSFILSDDEAVKQQALADLLKVQTEDFLAMFKTMSGRDVVVRLLDPPLHEFLDNPRELEVAITKKEAAGASEEELAVLRARLRRIDGMVESNPMLGLRGVRLSIVFGDLPLMQVRAVATAAARLIKEGVDPRPEIMVPLVSITAEHVQTREVIERVIAEVSAEEGVELNIPVGTMLELPRACMVADEIAKSCRLLLLWHQRPYPDDLRFLARRRRGQVHPAVPAQEDLEGQPLRDHRHGGARAGAHGRREGPRHQPRACTLACAASTAATPSPSRACLTWPTWTTCPARPTACPSRAWLPPRPSSRPGVPPNVLGPDA